MLVGTLRRILKEQSLLQYGGYCTSAGARKAVRDAQALEARNGQLGITG
jgi:hypothetical protein